MECPESRTGDQGRLVLDPKFLDGVERVRVDDPLEGPVSVA